MNVGTLSASAMERRTSDIASYTDCSAGVRTSAALPPPPRPTPPGEEDEEDEEERLVMYGARSAGMSMGGMLTEEEGAANVRPDWVTG